MLKSVFCCVLLLSCLALRAQSGFGPEVGIGMSSMHFAPAFGFTSASGSPVFSWRAGGNTDFELNKHIYLQAGLFCAQKGQNREFSFYTNDTLNASFHQTLTLYYAELPVSVLYKSGMQGKSRFFAGLGSVASYIIGGNNHIKKETSFNGNSTTVTHDYNVTYGNPVAMFDIGMALSAGFEAPTGFYIKLYYTVGMKDIGLGGEIDKNRMWGVGAGYLFGRGRNINKEKDELIDNTTD